MATPILKPDTTPRDREPAAAGKLVAEGKLPLLRLEQFRVVPSLNGLRIVSWAQTGLSVGNLVERIPNGRRRKAALDPLVEHGLVSKVGKRPDWMYMSNVAFPRLRDGSEVADYLCDPYVAWPSLAVMIGVALGAPVGNVQELARAIGISRESVRPYMADARVFHRTLFELQGIEAAVAHVDESAKNVTSSTGPDSGNVTSSQPEGAKNVTSLTALSTATAAVTPHRGVNQPAVPSPEHFTPPFDPDFALGDPPDANEHQPAAPKLGSTRAHRKSSRSHLPGSLKVMMSKQETGDWWGLQTAIRVMRGEMLTDEDERRWRYRMNDRNVHMKLLVLAEKLDRHNP